MQNLDDVNQTTICIPYAGPEGKQEALHKPSQPDDYPDGPMLRFEAYRAAWRSCLARIQAVLRDIYMPYTEEVIEHVLTAYNTEKILPGLPHPELPVVSVTGSTPAVLSEMETRLPLCYFAHLRPADCPSVLAGMRTLITGIMACNSDAGVGKRRPNASSSLANHDMNLLEVWYKARKKTLAARDRSGVKLLICLHDFEQFNHAVAQDILHICSLHIPSLPLVFLLQLSSPPSSRSFIHTMYPRSILSLLRIENVAIPRGRRTVEDVLYKTFFDPNHELPLTIGAGALEFIVEHTARVDNSIERLITVLQLVHLRHFINPLTALLHHSFPLHPPSSDVEPFVLRLVSRLCAFIPENDGQPPVEWEQVGDMSFLLRKFEEAKRAFQRKLLARKMVLGVWAILKARVVARKRHKNDVAEPVDVSVSVDMMLAVVKGKIEREVKTLIEDVKLFSPSELKEMKTAVNAFLGPHYDDEDDENSHDEDFVASFTHWMHKVSPKTTSEETAKKLLDFFRSQTADLGEFCKGNELNDLWYTGTTPFPSEVLNPSIPASISSGLLFPFDYILTDSKGKKVDDAKPLWHLPDTSILFARYLDSGRAINVADWFQSFKGVLLEQRRRLGAGHDVEDEELEREMHARFIRSVHELDYIGLIKQTGRKKGHVLKTLYDVPD